MSLKDLHSSIKAVQAIVPAVKTAAGDGTTIDTRGFASLEFVVTTGAVAGDGDFGIAVQHSLNGTDWVAVPAGDLLGSIPATLPANSTYRVGVTSGARYYRANVTKEGGTSLAIGAVALLGHPSLAPVA